MKKLMTAFYCDWLTERAIDSVKPDLLIDGAMQESTKALAEKKGVPYHGQRFRLIADQLNFLFEKGFETDDVVLRLENDTFKHEGLDHLERAITTYPDVGIFYGMQYDMSNQQWNEGFFGSFALRRSAWERLGPFDNSTIEDWDWARKFHELGVKTCTVLDFKYHHELHGTYKFAHDLQEENVKVRGEEKVAAYHKRWDHVPLPLSLQHALPYQESFGPGHIFVYADGREPTRKSPFR